MVAPSESGYDLSPDARRRLRGVSIRQLMYLIELARQMNFGKAAEILSVSQPTLSQQIKQLEETLGLSLLKREKRGFDITPEGAYLIARATSALDILGSGIDTLLSAQEDQPLRIGLPAYLSYPAVTQLLIRFRTTYPSIFPHFTEMPASVMAEQLMAGKLDVAFLSVPTPEKFAKTIRQQTVWKGTYWLCLSRDHPLAKKEVIAAEDFRNIDFILLPRSAHEAHYDSQYRSIAAICPDPKIIHTDVVHAQAQIELAAAGLGACLICPDTVQLGEQVVLRPTDPPLASSELAAFWSGSNLSPYLERFVQLLKSTTEER